MTSDSIIAYAREAGKEIRRLEGATFIGRSLFGDHPTKPGKSVKCSMVVSRMGENVFETLNSIYYVEWVPGGEATIPAEWKLP